MKTETKILKAAQKMVRQMNKEPRTTTQAIEKALEINFSSIPAEKRAEILAA